MSEVHDTAGKAAPAHLEGIGGWLILLGIGQVLGPIQFLMAMVEDYAGLPDGTFQRIPLAAFGDLALRTAFLGLLAYVAILFFNKRVEFPGMFIISYAVALAFPIVLAVWVSATSGVSIMPTLGTSDFLLPWFLGAVIGAIWVAYVLNSVRVKNTFVR